CGVPLARHIMERIDADVIFDQLIEEGAEVTFGDIAFTVKGSVHSILQAERLMLNFMQRMSGVATVTHNLVELIEGTNAKLLDTRKTTPGLRTFEKYAVTIGGGVNHRFALWDMVMLKDNHNDYTGGITGGVTRTKEYLKSKGKDIKIEVETRDLNEVQEALDTGLVDRIMFDNFTPELMVEAVKLVNGQCETEASGGITGDTVRSYAETGVDYISVGALTHSVRSLDLSLKEF
ncbi:carboxylating nicotinate-nucleotide diphosphorylase, partial [Bacteroidia bacterium]|nr:carboxylating nicotinate-nucleotide diphosphorylase [Bacteroidia bacterium]MDA9110942.1 carboxylating nicotinate-nucleotide diphosphorylase [Bacteroidia bacterium]